MAIIAELEVNLKKTTKKLMNVAKKIVINKKKNQIYVCLGEIIYTNHNTFFEKVRNFNY